MLTDRQAAFCAEYIIDCNASAAYVRAGYCAKGANALAARLIAKDSIRARIDALMAEKDAARIASGDEVLRYLTGVMRGEATEEIVTTVGTGNGFSEVERVRKEINAKERIRAAELIGKRYGLFSDRLAVDVTAPVIVDDVGRAKPD